MQAAQHQGLPEAFSKRRDRVLRVASWAPGYQLFQAMCGEDGPFSDQDILAGMSEAAFSLRLRVGCEDAWQSRKERNFLEVVAAKPLPWTFKSQMRITAPRGAATGSPGVFLDDCSVNVLGHLVLAKTGSFAGSTFWNALAH